MKSSSKPINILQVFGSLNMGGAESRMMDVFRNIDRNKYAFTFLSMSEGKQYYDDEIVSLGGKIIKIKSPRKDGVIKHFAELYKIIKKGNFQVVHAHTSFHCGLVMMAAWLCGVKIRIAHSRTTGTRSPSFLSRIRIAIGKALIKLFSTVKIAISNEAGHFLFGSKSFYVIPNAIDFDKYLNTEESVIDKIRNEYEIDENDICLGMVGRFETMKNHSFAIDVFDKYHSNNEKSKLILVGDGILRASIEEKARKLDLSKSVFFVGIQSNINEWMKLFDVLLVPSIFEGLGGVILEAQASKTPVIKSDSFTNESDMGIGLVQEISINNGSQAWVDGVEKSLTISIPDSAIVRDSFIKNGYSLSKTIEILSHIYCGDSI